MGIKSASGGILKLHLSTHSQYEIICNPRECPKTFLADYPDDNPRATSKFSTRKRIAKQPLTTKDVEVSLGQQLIMGGQVKDHATIRGSPIKPVLSPSMK